nr:hypothetical protein [Tanacetum cinerariifolium]
MEQVFEINKCADEYKVKFAACTFEGRALTWWNENVQALGLANANQIPWNNVKIMMTTEYCLATEIQRMKHELWTLTLKEKKKIKRYIRGLPERVKENVTSSKPTSLHDGINMARELVEQDIQGKATRIGKRNKKKGEDHKRNISNNNNNNNRSRNNNNQHQQQNKRQDVAKAYAAALAEGKGYTRNLPLCNRYHAHHHGPCPPRCGRFHK